MLPVNSRFVLKLALIILIVYGIFSLGISHLASSDWAEEMVREQLLSILDTNWGIEVAFDEIVPTGFGQITLTNLKVQLPGQAPAAVESLSVQLDLARLLLMPWQWEKAISKVTLDNLYLEISRNESGEWNLPEFPSDAGGNQRARLALNLGISIRGGQVAVKGWPDASDTIQLHDIDGMGRITRQGIAWHLTAGNSLITTRKTTAQGRVEWGVEPIPWHVRISALDVDARSYQRSGVFSIPGVELLDGTGDVVVTLRGAIGTQDDPGAPLAYMVQVDLAAARGKTDFIPQELQQVSGRVWYDGANLGFEQLTGCIGESKVTVSGRVWNWEVPNLDLQVAADSLRLEDVAACLAYHRIAPFEQDKLQMAGEIQGELRLAGLAKDPLLRGQLSVTDGMINLKGFGEPIAALNGQAEFQLKQVHFGLSFDWLGGDATVTGQVYNLLDPILALQVEAMGQVDKLAALRIIQDSLGDFAGAGRTLDAAGQFHLLGEILGSWQSPEIGGNLKLTDLRAFGKQFGDLSLIGGYRDSRFVISELTVRQPQGGQLQAAGFINSGWAEFAFGLQLKEFDIDPAVLMVLVDSEMWEGVQEFLPQLQKVSGSVLAKGKGTDLRELALSGTLDVQDMAWRKTDLHQMTAGFTMSHGRFQLDYLQLVSEKPLGTAISTAGEIVLGKSGLADATIDLNVDVANLDLAGLAVAHELSGTVSFHGGVTGQLFNPTVRGDVSVEAPGWQPYEVDRLSGHLQWANGIMQLSDGRVELADEQVRVFCEMVFTPELKLDLRAQVENGSVATLLSLYENAPAVTGQVSGTAHLSIGSAGVSGKGSITASQVAWEGESISQLALEVAFADGILTIRDGQAELLGGVLQAAGTVAASGWNMDLDLNNIDVGRSALLKARNLEVEGIVSGKVQVQGELHTPKVLGAVAARDVAWNDYRLDQVDGTIGYEDGNLLFNPVYLRHEQGVYALSGTVQLAGEPQLDLRVQLARGSLEDVLSLVGVPAPEELTGQLDGYVHLWGAAKSPTGRIYLSVSNGLLYGTSLEGDVDVTLYGSRLHVNRLRLEHGQGLLIGQGKLAKEGAIDFFLAGQAVPIESLCTLLKVPMEVVGIADGELVLAGTAANPQGELTVNVVQTTLGGIELGDIAGRLTLTGSRLAIDALEVQGRDYEAHAQGYLDLPEDIVGKVGVADAKPRSKAEVNVTFQLPESDALLLGLFVPGLAIQQGTIYGEFGVAGTWSEPQIKGVVGLDHAALTYPGLGLIEDVQLGAVLKPGKVILEHLTGTIGDGKARAAGEIELKGLRPSQFDLTLVTDNVAYRNDMLSAVFDGEVSLAGPPEMPTIAGSVAVKQGKVQLKLPQMGAGNWNANLDLDVHTADDVIVRGFGVDLMLAGAVHVGGTVQDPALDGKVTVTRGNVNYLGTKFALLHGSAEFASARGINPYLDVRGEAKLDGVGVTLLLQGTLDKLSTELRSEPEMPDQELMAMLGWPGRISALLSGSQVDSGLDEEMAKLIEAELARQFVGDLASTFQSVLDLDDLQIKPSFMEKSIQIEVGKYVLDDVYITYSRKLQEFAEQKWGIEYRLNPNVVLEGNIDSSGEKRIQLKGKFSF